MVHRIQLSYTMNTTQNSTTLMARWRPLFLATYMFMINYTYIVQYGVNNVRGDIL